MRIAEIYRSVQGEGRLTGTDSVFVRTSGCNLRCWFCDTPYTSWNPEGSDLPVSEIVRTVLQWDVSHVVVTGGEPMLFAELIPLTEHLAAHGRHITIETAGTLYLPVTCHLMSLSPKLSNSAPDAGKHPGWHARHEQSREVPDVIRRIVREFDCQVKFVVDTPADVDDVMIYLDRYQQIERSQVYLMPQGTDLAELEAKQAWLGPLCQIHGCHVCPRRHIEWFGAVRAT